MYDGQGFWLCQKRLSQGRFPRLPDTLLVGRPCVQAIRFAPIGCLNVRHDSPNIQPVNEMRMSWFPGLAASPVHWCLESHDSAVCGMITGSRIMHRGSVAGSTKERAICKGCALPFLKDRLLPGESWHARQGND